MTRRSVLFAPLASAAVLWPRKSFGAAVRLSGPVRASVLDDLSPGYSVWQYRDGALIRYWTTERYSTDKSPNVWLWGASGELALEVRVLPDDAYSFVIWDVAGKPLGGLAVSGTAVSTNGKMAEAICILDESGNLERTIRTNPFVAKRLTYSSDGSLWAFGRNLESDDASVGYEVFERYDSEGRRSGAFLARSSFSGRLPSPSSSPAEMAGGPGGLTWLRACPEFVGAYSGPAREWVELGLDGELRGRWPLSAVPGEPELLMTLAVTESGRVFAWKAERGVSGLYELDRDAARWRAVSNAQFEQTRPELGPLLGADGERLVLRGGWRDPSSLVWVDVVDGA